MLMKFRRGEIAFIAFVLGMAPGFILGVAGQQYNTPTPLSAQTLANRDSCVASVTAMAERDANTTGAHVMKLAQVMYVTESNDGVVCSAQFELDRDGKRSTSTSYTVATASDLRVKS